MGQKKPLKPYLWAKKNTENLPMGQKKTTETLPMGQKNTENLPMGQKKPLKTYLWAKKKTLKTYAGVALHLTTILLIDHFY